MAPGDGRDWRGGKRRREAAPSEQSAPGWKQSRQPVRTQAKTRSPKLKAILPAVALAILVGIAIWMYLVAKPHYTHLLVINPLKGAEWYSAGDAPEITRSESGFFGTRRTLTSPLSDFDLDAGLTRSREELRGNRAGDAQQTIVVYVQTIFLADPVTGSYRCLINNSDFDLNANSSYLLLSDLKQQLLAIREENPATGIVLLLDMPPVASAMRLGWLHAETARDAAAWTSEIDRLVVVSSCAPKQTSVYAGMGAGGRTAFSHFADLGFSKIADSDSDNEITVSEYCRYVQEATSDWVRHHRQTTGQTVTVTPPVEELTADDGAGDFLVLKGPEDGDASINGLADSDIEQHLSQSYSQLNELSESGVMRWSPLLWRLSERNLFEAEVAYLNGQFDVSEEYLSKVDLWLKQLQQEADGSSSDSWNTSRGLKRDWFEGLPVAARLQNVWGDETTDSDDQPTVEGILRRCLETYPYAALQIDQHSDADIDSVVDRRRLAEQSAASAFGSVHQIRETILEAEQRLLMSEDLQFVGTSDATAPSAAETELFLRTIGDYAVAWQQGEATLVQLLNLGPTLAEWAAGADVLCGTDQAAEWEELLERNHVDTAPTRAFVDDLLTRVERIEGESTTSWRDRGRQMRSEIFRLLVQGRHLQSLLVTSEPEGGFETDKLRTLVRQIQQEHRACADSLAKIRELSQQLTESVLQEDFTQRDARIGIYRRCRNVMLLPTLPPSLRTQLLRRVVTLDGQLAAPVEPTDADSESAAASSDAATNHDLRRAGMLWTAQVISLDPRVQPEDEDAARAVWKMLVSDDSDQAIANGSLGAAVRSYWRDRRTLVSGARDTDITQITARIAELDHIARLLPAVDAEQLSPELFNPTILADQLRLLDFDLLQVDRLVLGHWVDTSDDPPYRKTGWYARTAAEFLSSADRRLDTLEREALSARVALRQQVESRRNALVKFDGLSVRVAANESLVNLGLQNQPRDDIELTPQVSGVPPEAGIASLNLVADSNNGALSSLRVEGNALPLSLGSPQTPGKVTVVRIGNPLEGDCQSVVWNPEVFYRGRRLAAGAVINVNPCAEETFTVERAGRPDTGTVVLRDKDSRPIAFVLDWSGSMKDPTKTEPRRVRKEVALESLRETVRRLDDSKKASLRVFAHRIKYDADVDDHLANDTYENVFRPDSDDWKKVEAQEDVKRELPLRRMNPQGVAQFNSILGKLEGVDPWGMTPLVYSVTRALIEDLENGSGIVIVITDGADNDPNKNVRIRELRKQIRNVQQSTRLVVVAFDVRDENGRDTEERQAIENLFTVDGVPFAEIVDARNKDELSEVIANSFDPKKFTLRRSRFTEDSYPPSNLNAAITGVRPGDDYVIEFGELSTEGSIPISIERGDSHRVSIDWRYPQFVFDRRSAPQHSVSAVVPDGQPETAPTMLQALAPAAYSNPRTVDNVRIATVGLTLLLNHNRVDLPVAQPAEVEFEYLTRTGEEYQPGMVQEKFTSEPGAPGYEVTLSDWPEIQDVVVHASWKMTPTPPDLVLTWEELSQSATAETARDIGGQDNPLPAASVWTSLTSDGSLQVRLDPKPGLPEADGNRVRDVRVAIGRRDTFGTNARFITEEVTVKSTTTRAGSLVYEFLGPFTAESLRRLEIAFTSAVSYEAGVIRTARPLEIPRTGN